VILRERSPLEAAARSNIGAVTGRAEAALRRYAQSRSYEALVADFAAGPPFWSVFAIPLVRDRTNLSEYVIHHEDVRRAGGTFEPRSLGVDRQRGVFGYLPFLARLGMRNCPARVTQHWRPGDEVVVGDGAPVTVSGSPVELALLASGRGRVARVDYAGPADAIAGVRQALD
jgi:uncharacterized protein (TIGR03085 family)